MGVRGCWDWRKWESDDTRCRGVSFGGVWVGELGEQVMDGLVEGVVEG